MNNDHSYAALLISWGGSLLALVTLSHLIGAATLIFTVLNIVISIRKLRREARLERLQAELQRPEQKP